MTQLHRNACLSLFFQLFLKNRYSLTEGERFPVLVPIEDSGPEYVLAVTVQDASTSSPQQAVTRSRGDKAKLFAEERTKRGAESEVALTYILFNRDEVLFTVVPLALFDEKKQPGGVFSYTERGGYYFNHSKFKELSSLPGVIAAVRMKVEQ